MPKFFICYRREDSAYPAQMICQRLVSEYAADSVVFDVDSVPLGADFREYLDEQVSKCDVLLAVIGRDWLDILSGREEDSRDFVRVEIESALERNIPIVPVLLEGAFMPAEDSLPPSLAVLAFRHAAEVHAGKDLTSHLDRLIVDLERALKEREEARKAAAEALQRAALSEDSQRAAQAAAITVFVAAVGPRLRKAQDRVRIELTRRGFQVIRGRARGGSADLRERLRSQLDRSHFSVHLVGHEFAGVSDESSLSIEELQIQVAAECGTHQTFSRIVWILPQFERAEDERQVGMLNRLLRSPIGARDELMVTSLEELIYLVLRRAHEASSEL